ncbi:hypothetical protein ACP8HI_01315 [Paenibacillus sp. FA6]|uniref:hypothetical protein n=1 Tax=Paenibacillus sp. FA6 TaxID=3413029 RepID=UPI003F656C5F
MDRKPKGFLWKLAQSWWILLPFTFYFNWIAYIYIGRKVKHKRWTMYGALYAIPFFLVFIDMLFKINSSILTYVWSVSLLLGTFISIIHAFNIRIEFLTRLEARQFAKKYLDETLIHQIESEYGLGPHLPTSTQYDGPAPATVFTKGPIIRQS